LLCCNWNQTVYVAVAVFVAVTVIVAVFVVVVVIKVKWLVFFYFTLSTVVSNLIMVVFTFEIQLDAWDTIPTSGMQKVVLISSDQSKKLTHKILHIIYICILDDFNFTASRWDLTRCICKRNDKKIQEN
jgi:hypothetical protein